MASARARLNVDQSSAGYDQAAVHYAKGTDAYQPNEPVNSFPTGMYGNSARVTRGSRYSGNAAGTDACVNFYKQLFKSPGDVPITWSSDGSSFGHPGSQTGTDTSKWTYDNSFWAKGSNQAELSSMLGGNLSDIDNLVIPYICENREKADEIIDNIADILNALMDRLATMPGLLHTNNMLLMRNQVLDSDINRVKTERDTFKAIRSNLLNEQQKILEQIMIMAKQIHRLHSGMATGKLAALVDPSKTNDATVPNQGSFGLAPDRLYALKNILAGVVTGQIMGMPLAGGNQMPTLTLSFTALRAIPTGLNDATATASIKEVLKDIATRRVHKRALVPVLQSLVDTVVAANLREEDGVVHLDLSSGSATALAPEDANNAFLLATLMVELAVDHKLLSTKAPLTPLYANGDPELNLSSYEVRQISGRGRGRGRDSNSNSDGGNTSRRTVVVDITAPPGAEREAAVQAIYDSLPERVKAAITLEVFKRDHLRTGSGEAYNGNMSFWGNVGRFFRGESVYSANEAYMFDLDALLAAAGIDTTDPANVGVMTTFLSASIPNVARIELKETVAGEVVDVEPVQLVDADIAAGAGGVELLAKADSKAAQLEKIKAIINSNEVKEFIRVRPYVDTDDRATELQLSTIDQLYIRSAVKSVAQGQLGTKVKYDGMCMDFTGVFKKLEPNDQFFERFQGFLPKGKPAPPASQWFATVNGGVFPEFVSYKERGVTLVPSDFLKVRKYVDLKINYAWVPNPSAEDSKRKWVQPVESHATLITAVKKQLATSKKFNKLFNLWKADASKKITELNDLIGKLSKEPEKKAKVEAALAAIPPPTEDGFAAEYLNVRVTSDAINKEFVDTIWPVLEVFFGPPDADGIPMYNETKNVVAFFYGASGSGKTFTAEAILDKVFESVKTHPDDFQLKIVTDYNNSLFDYYGTMANKKLVHNMDVQKPKQFYNPDKAMRKQSFAEMAKRAKYLSGVMPGSAADLNFFEGNISVIDETKAKSAATRIHLNYKRGEKVSIDNLSTFTPEFAKAIAQQAEHIRVMSMTPKEKKEEEKEGGSTSVDPGAIAEFADANADATSTMGKKFIALVQSNPKTPKVIPKNETEFKLFKKDFERRVREFRSVTDTGLNPESSRSHLLYLVQRVTKNGAPMPSTDRGSLFVLADFAGTENLGYLFTDEARALWNEWDDHSKHSTKPCLVAGKAAEGDWACLDLPALAKAKTVKHVFKGTKSTEKYTKFRAALVAGWRNVKIKTLVATDIADMASIQGDMETLKATLTAKWDRNLNLPYVTTGTFDAEGNELDLSDEKQVAKGAYVYLDWDTIKSSTNAVLKAVGNASKNSRGDPSLKLATEKGLVETNPHRFDTDDTKNNDVIVDMVLAMHAESKHINDSLKQIADLVNAQRDATKTNPLNKADIEGMIAAGTLSKTLVVDILAPAVTAGSTAVAVGAINPRRTGDYDTWCTMDNITAMRGSCAKN